MSEATLGACRSTTLLALIVAGRTLSGRSGKTSKQGNRRRRKTPRTEEDDSWMTLRVHFSS